jgi:DNA-binding HxlR family transcriptional regulator
MKKKTKFISSKEFEKANTELQIMQVLKEGKGKLRWKNLLDGIRKTRNMRISTRTLSNRLKDLEKSGFVRRIIDTSVYPPAVYYEITTRGHKAEFPFVAVLSELQNFEISIDAFRSITGVLKTRLESNDPEAALEIISLDYLNYLLTTLYLCLDAQPEALPFIMDHNVSRYEIMLKTLITEILNSPALAKAVKDTYQRLRKEEKETIKKYEDKFCAEFKDKELSKVVVSQFALMKSYGEVKTLKDFFKKILEDELSHKAIEKRFGKPISEKRLKNLLSDPAWKTLDYKSENFS